MRHFRLFQTILASLAFMGFMGSQTALSAYPAGSEFSVNQPPKSRGPGGSFQLAVMGTSTSPLDIPVKKIPNTEIPKAQSPKPAVEKAKAAPKSSSKPKKKKVKTVKAQKAPKKKPVVVEKKEEEGFLTKTLKTLVGGNESAKNPASKSLVEKSVGKNSKPPEDEGLLTKTLKTLVSDDEKEKKKSAAKPKPQKTAGKKAEPKKKQEKKQEEGLLTKTLKTLVGGDEDEKEKKKEKTAKKKSLDPIHMVPTGSVTHKKEKVKKEETKTAKSETKKTIKESFEKLIGVGAVDKEKIETTPDKATQQAKAVKKVEEKPAPPAPPRPKRITARKYIEEEEAQLEKDRGGVKKGKNILKESFKTLVNEEKKKKAPTE